MIQGLILLALLYLPGHLLARRLAAKGDGFAELLLLRAAVSAAAATPVLAALALLGRFDFLGVAAGGVTCSFCAWLVSGGRGVTWRDRFSRWDAGALGLVAGSLALYAMRPGEHYLNTRDPGVYAILSAKLARTGELLTFDPLVAAVLPFHEFADGKKYPGFYIQGDGWIFPQFFPGPFGWLGYGDLAFGTGAALYVVPVFGAVSVGIVYALGRELFGRLAGLFGAALLAVGYVQVYWSRQPSSEVMTQFFVLGGIWTAARFLRNGDRGTGALAASLFGGAIVMRVDAFMALAALPLILTCDVVARRSLRRWLVPAAVLAVFGGAMALYAATIGRRYIRILYTDHGLDRALELTPAAALGFSMAVAVILLVRWRFGGRLEQLLTMRGGEAAMLATLGIGALVLWAYFVWPVPWESLPVDSADFDAYRSQGVVRMSWFITPLIGVLSLAGLLLAARRPDAGRTIFLGAVLAFGVLYVAVPNVAPDLPWATRRFVPAVVPGVCLLAGYAVAEIGRGIGRLFGRWISAASLAALAIAAIGWTVYVALPVYGERELAGSYAEISELNAAVPDAEAIFMELPDRFDHYASPLEYLHGRPVMPYDRERFVRELDGLREAGLLKDAVYVTAYKGRRYDPPPQASGISYERVGTAELDLSRLERKIREVPREAERLDLTFRVYRIEPEEKH